MGYDKGGCRETGHTIGEERVGAVGNTEQYCMVGVAAVLG